MNWKAKAGFALLGAGLLYGALLLWDALQEGPDRPPIIVGDGSVNIIADHDPHGKGRGEWDQASDKRWTHKNNGGAPTRRFDVSVRDGSGDAGCDDENTFISATDLTVSFTGNRRFRLWIDPAIQDGQKKAIVDFEDGTDVIAHKAYWLKIPNPPSTPENPVTLQLTKVTIGAISCSLGSDGEIRVYQRKK